MSSKSIIQLIILISIFIILGSVYFKYFSKEKIIIDHNAQKSERVINSNSQEKDKYTNESEVFNSADEDQSKKRTETRTSKTDLDRSKKKEAKEINIKSNSDKKKDTEIPNIVKDVEYLTTDKNGNKYKILASSGRTNENNKNILDLDNVKGEITSDQKSKIYIVSEFAQYNSLTLDSKFFSNVVINYEDKQINCENFDINMDTNMAIAYNNVVVTDPKSTMKAGKIALNIESKEIDINPDIDGKNKIKINTKQ